MRKSISALLLIIVVAMLSTTLLMADKESGTTAEFLRVDSEWLILDLGVVVGEFAIEEWVITPAEPWADPYLAYFINLNNYYSHEVDFGPLADPPYLLTFPNGVRVFIYFDVPFPHVPSSGSLLVQNPPLPNELQIIRVSK